jgi:tetratricopeptide (TPR) repeat protein/predicted Ser/Thr protein kinase
MAGIDDLLHTGGALKGAIARDALEHASGRLLAAGDRVGPFRILGELGRGGMGVVYEAERVDGAFEQRVAIKWLLARGGDARVAQFRRERQILAGLRHRHIARLLDGGETGDGMLWFAMERIEGRPIDRWCAEQRAGLRARVALFEQVCEAIAFAHARLLVHRDIKPSNVLVDSDGSAKLVDFGIAHALDDSAGAVDAFTPGFASPEQAAGAPSSVGADIYSLGVLLKALLHPPAVREGSDASPDPAGAELPAVADLDAIAARAAAPAVAARYATVEALLEDLRRFRTHRPVEAYRGGIGYRADKFVRRHWLVVTVAAAALVLLVALSAVFVGRLKEERDLAENEAEKANAVTDFVVDLLRSADPAVHRGDKLSVVDVIGRGESRADLELADKPDVHARLLGVLGDVQLNLSNYAEAMRLNERTVALMKSLPGTSKQVLAQRLRTAAQCAWRLDQHERGLAFLDEAETYNRGADRDAYTAVSILRTRANILGSLGRTEEGERASIAAVQTARDELPPGSTILGRALIGAALHDEVRSDFARALDKAREAAAIFAAAEGYGPSHPDSFVAQGNSALYLMELSQPEAALRILEANLARMQAVIGEDHARFVRQAALAARISLSMGDAAHARGWLARARPGMARVENLGHQAWLDVALAEGWLAMAESRPADARDWFARLDTAAQGREPEAMLGLVHAHCVLGTQHEIADRLAELRRFVPVSPRRTALRERALKACGYP